MAFTIGSGTFTNGSATVTGVTLTSGTLAYFASGTRMVVGVNPVIQEVEAIAAPTVSTITLRSAWTGTGGTYSFLANQTSEGLRDAVQAIRTNNASLQSFIDSIDTAATADSVAQRDASGQLIATNLITADKIIHDGDTNTAIRFPAADTVTVETNGSERLRVDSSGNVGIGGTPTVKLTVRDDSASPWVLSKRGASELYMGISSTFGASFESNDIMRFATGASFTERMRIDSGGNLLFGTTIPPGTSNSTAIRKGDAGQLILVANNGGLYHQDVGNYYLVTTAGGSTSDETLKKDVEQLSGALEKVCSIRGVNFKFIDEPMCTADKGIQLGVIAQEVESVYPEIVLTNDEGKKTVRYDRLVAPVIEAVKEQQEIIKTQSSLIETLAESIAALEARIEALEG